MNVPIAENVINEFLEELTEMTERISRGLTVLEKAPGDQAVIRSLYRDVHTIKGNAMMFGLPLLGRLSHAMENVLEVVRESEQDLGHELIQQIFSGLDLIGAIASGLRDAGAEPGIEIAIDAMVDFFHSSLQALAGRRADSEIDSHDEPTSVASDETVKLVVPAADTKKLPETVSQESPIASPVTSRQQTEEVIQDSIRVSVSILDKLVNLVGEIVLVRNQYQERAKVLADEDVQISQRLNLVTAELQNEVMKTRMQPVGNILNKFHRVVRDLSKELGKETEVEIKGTDTELDKALLEAIRDPLMHIVRNSADHGIEVPEVRLANGKPRSGLISVSASQQGGQVVIEISDDGKGLHVEKIRAKAVEKGLITSEAASNISERDTFNLIFRPGFSTADKVSNVSGRGVGMDVVKTNIERIGGTVEVRSVAGHGSTTILRIPLTLAIMPALLVKVNNASLAIPQARLIELLRVEFGADTARRIEVLEGRPFFRLRGQLLPLVGLDSVLSQTDVNDEVTRSLLARQDGVNIVVVDGEGVTFGLIVDEIEDSIDIVIKPLGQVLNAVSVFSGSTILGDGNIALLLDVTGVAAYAGVSKSVEANKLNGARTTSNHATEALLLQDEVDYLIVKLDTEGEYAIPVCNVSRLEEFSRDEYHKAGDFLVSRYREGLLPILSVREILGLEPKRESGRRSDVSSVIVVARGGKLYGLEVEEIVDIIATTADMDSGVRDRAGLLGGFIHNDSVFVVVDVFEVIDQVVRPGASAEVSSSHDVSSDLKQKRKKFRILLAEDSNFFRKQVSYFLVESGYQVSAAIDGSKAWDMISGAERQSYHLLLSDIEMPEMDGVTLARKVRERSEFRDLPMIAVTTKYSEKDVKIGLDAGFNHYMQKLDREELISEIDRALGLAG